MAHSDCAAINFHMCISHSTQYHGICIIYNRNMRGFNGMHSDCFTPVEGLKDSVYKISLHFVFTSNHFHVQFLSWAVVNY